MRTPADGRTARNAAEKQWKNFLLVQRVRAALSVN